MRGSTRSPKRTSRPRADASAGAAGGAGWSALLARRARGAARLAALFALLVVSSVGQSQEAAGAGASDEAAKLAVELPDEWRGSCDFVVVASDEQGQPLPGVEVGLRLGESPSVLRGLITGPEGTLSLSGLAAGEWQVELRREGFMLYTAYIKLEPGKEPEVGFKSRQRTGSFWAPLEAVFLSAEDAVTPAVRTGRKSAREAEKEARRQAKREEEARRREERRVEQGRAARLVASPEQEATEPEATELEATEETDDDEAAAQPEDRAVETGEGRSAAGEREPAPTSDPTVPERPTRSPAGEPGAERERRFSPALSDPPSRPDAESPVAPAAHAPDATAFPRLLPNPDLLPAGACPECRPDEWSVAAESVAAAAGSCAPAEATEPVMSRLASALTEHLEGPLAAYAGALWSKDGNDALRLLPDALEQELRGLLDPVVGEETSCPVVAVVLPESSRYVGFRYAAGQRSGMAECPPGQGCLIGEAAWRGNPEILEAGAVKLVWARFENASAQRQRMPRLTVYFAPARTWLPPSR